MRRKRRNKLQIRSQLQRQQRNIIGSQKTIPVQLKGGTPFWFRIIELIGIFIALAALIYTVLALNVAQKSLELTKISLHQESLARAWSILATPSSGNSGKKSALETLYENNIELNGLDLSCKRMGGGWNKESNYCQRKTYLIDLDLSSIKYSTYTDEKGNLHTFDGPLSWKKRAYLKNSDFSGVDLNKANLKGAALDYSNFSGSNLSKVNFSYALLRGVQFSDADIYEANFQEADLYFASFENVTIGGSDFSETNLSGVFFDGATVVGNNISGTIFCGPVEKGCVHGFTDQMIKDSWAYSDQWNPDLLPEYLKNGPKEKWPSPLLCNPKHRDVINNFNLDEYRTYPPEVCLQESP